MLLQYITCNQNNEVNIQPISYTQQFVEQLKQMSRKALHLYNKVLNICLRKKISQESEEVDNWRKEFSEHMDEVYRNEVNKHTPVIEKLKAELKSTSRLTYTHDEYNKKYNTYTKQFFIHIENCEKDPDNSNKYKEEFAKHKEELDTPRENYYTNIKKHYEYIKECYKNLEKSNIDKNQLNAYEKQLNTYEKQLEHDEARYYKEKCNKYGSCWEILNEKLDRSQKLSATKRDIGHIYHEKTSYVEELISYLRQNDIITYKERLSELLKPINKLDNTIDELAALEKWLTGTIPRDARSLNERIMRDYNMSTANFFEFIQNDPACSDIIYLKKQVDERKELNVSINEKLQTRRNEFNEKVYEYCGLLEQLTLPITDELGFEPVKANIFICKTNSN